MKECSMFTVERQATTNALTDLYSREEYIESLRNEVQGHPFDDFRVSADGLPLLDSSLKNPQDSVHLKVVSLADLHAMSKVIFPNSHLDGVRRQALTPFTFSDGLQIPIGDWMCVPHRSMTRDDRYFQDPLDFDGLHFIKSCKPSKLTDASEEWLVWGSGRILWYVLKVRLNGDVMGKGSC
jgi:hypothetical protein